MTHALHGPSLRQHVLRGFASALIPCLLYLGLGVSGLVTVETFLLPLVAILLVAIAAAVVVLALVCWGVARVRRVGSLPRVRQMARASMAWSAAFAVSTLVLLPVAFSVRSLSFRVLAWRSEPLVAAIHAFQHEHGAPPPSLVALVPGYLSAVPATGMQAYPDYEYSVFRASSSRAMHWYDLGNRQGAKVEGLAVWDAGDFDHAIMILITDHADTVIEVEIDRLPTVSEELPFDKAAWTSRVDRIAMARDVELAIKPVGRTLGDVVETLGPPAGSSLLARPEWELKVGCGEALKFDRFVYWPSETYPAAMYGGSTRRIGDWAYIDE